MADEEAGAGLQSLAHLMARVQRAAAHAHRQGDDRLQTLRSHESDVSFLKQRSLRLFVLLHQNGSAQSALSLPSHASDVSFSKQ